jgi:hypothetical protein
MSRRKWAVGKFRAVLPITNRLRFGSGVLTQCGVQPLANNPLQAANSSATPRMTAGSTSAHDGGT